MYLHKQKTVVASGFGLVAIALILLLLATVSHSAETFEDRARATLEACAGMALPTPVETYDRFGDAALQKAVAMFGLGRNPEGVALVDSALQFGTGAMFYWYYLIYTHLKYGDKLPQITKDAIRTKITKYGGGIRGTTENHLLMYATAFTLARQIWPTETFSHPNFESGDPSGSKWIVNWMTSTVKRGYHESDTYFYDVFYTNCLAALNEFSTDPLLAHRAKMTMDWLLLNGAGQYLKGYRIAPTHRGINSPQNYESPHEPGMTTIAYWLYFGDSPQMNLIDSDIGRSNANRKAVLNAVSPYRCPEAIIKIATDRTAPFVHRETHVKNSPLGDQRGYYRTTYIAPFYGICGEKDLAGNTNIGFSDALVRWYVRWVSDSLHSTFNVFNPAFETPGYAGTTHYEEVMSHKRSLIGVCRFDDATKAKFLYGRVSKRSISDRLEQDGWLLMHGGTVLIAVRFANGFTWDTEDANFRNIKSIGMKNSYAVETAEPQEFPAATRQAQLQSFCNHLVAKTHYDTSTVNGNPGLRYLTRDGDTLRLVYTNSRAGDYSLNGNAVDYYNTWPLIENPWCFQKEGDTNLDITYGGENYRYDFANWTMISPSIVKPDLVIARLSISPDQVSAGTAMTFSATVRNAGNSPTIAGSFATVFRVQEPGGHWNDAAFATVSTTLAPGDSVIVTGSPPFTPASFGTYLLQVTVDDGNVVDELFDDNNTASRTFLVAKPNLALGKSVMVKDAAVPKLTDADPYGTWTSVALPETLVVDLESTVMVDQVVLRLPPQWATARTMSFSVEGKINGNEYTVLAEPKSYSFGGLQMKGIASFAGTAVQFLRIVVTDYAVGSNPDTKMILSELEVYGPQPATSNKPSVRVPEMTSFQVHINGRAFSVTAPYQHKPMQITLYSLHGRHMGSSDFSGPNGNVVLSTPKSIAAGSYLVVLSGINGKRLSTRKIWIGN